MHFSTTIDRLKSSFGKLKEESFDFELIEKYFRKKNHSSALQTLSEKTCNDLDFNELFMFLDRTNSKVGQQYLYNRLRNIPADADKTVLHENIIQKLSADADLRVKTQIELEKLKKNDAYYISSLFQEEQVQPPKHFFVFRLLSFTSLMCILFIPFNPQLLMVLIAVIVTNLVIHYRNKRHLYQYLVSIPQLLILNKTAGKLSENQTFNHINPALAQSIRIINQIKRRMSLFQLEAGLQSDIQDVFWTMLELIKIVFLLEPLLLFDVLKRLETKREEIEEVFSFIGEVDMLVSIASLRAGLDFYCLPAIKESVFSITDIYHPLIFQCVPNSIELKGKSALLTGSNMSGKTSFIRAIGINTLTALTINTCFARSMTTPRMRIYSAIRISDDLLNDKSYYFEEVLTIKDMMTRSREQTQNLFLLDEIFKGTNTVERISAGKAVLSYLTENQNIVFVATHDIELTDMLSEQYDLYHFSEIIKDKNVGFDYTLKAGKLQNRNAIRILQINDYPENVISEAIKTAQKLDEEKA